MKCTYCNRDVKMVTGKTIYPKSEYLHGKFFYFCRPCDAYCGVHEGTNKPLGTVANARTRQLRMKAHDKFDRIWKNGKMSRSEAYKWMSNEMRLTKDDAHIGKFNDDQCLKLIELCAKGG